MIEEIMMSSLRLSIPLIFAAFAGLMSERSGIANIALESYLLFSAFFAAAITALTGNLLLGSLAGVLSAGVIGALFSFVCVKGRGDQIVIGTAFNFLAVGLIPVLNKWFFGVTGSTPSLPLGLRFSEPLYFLAVAGLGLVGLEFLFRRTRHGLRVVAAGEYPQALVTQGVSIERVRIRAVIEGSLIAGVGGIYLSLCQGSGYVREMSAGRGFIALAALIFGGWKPIPTVLACFFFGFTDAIQIQMQGREIAGLLIPSQIVQILPYAATLFVLVVFAQKIRAPGAINQSINQVN